VGLQLNAKKSEIMGFGFDPKAITVEGQSVEPCNTLKFLGCHIQKHLGWDKQVKVLCNTLRQTAGRIRFEGRNMTVNDRKVLYHGWISGRMLSNAGAYLPLLNETQKKDIQTASNSAVRAVAGLPRKGNYPLSAVRDRLGIKSVEEVCQTQVLVEAWKLQPVAQPTKGLMTRANQRGDVKPPQKKGWSGKLIKTKTIEAWNRLPQAIRQESKEKKAKTLINEFVKKKLIL